MEALRLVDVNPILGEATSGLSLGMCSGLLLMGGGDVNPALYGEDSHPETEPPDDERDAVEGAMIVEALARNIPIFAICRGMQILNVQLGGSLIQHLHATDRHRKRTPDRGQPAHSVQVEPGTLLAEIAQAPLLQVNSRHHQAIARLGAGLQFNARDSDDGTVEGLELPHRSFVLAVQWHPENQAASDPSQGRLFERFARAMSDHSSTLKSGA